MPKTSASFPQSYSSAPGEAWRLGWMISEMWLTSAYNVFNRTTWLSGAVPGANPADKAAMNEWRRMWSEKLIAGMEVSMEMQRAGYDLLLGRCDPWQASSRMLKPVHKRSVSNTWRLALRPLGV